MLTLDTGASLFSFVPHLLGCSPERSMPRGFFSTTDLRAQADGSKNTREFQLAAAFQLPQLPQVPGLPSLTGQSATGDNSIRFLPSS